MSNAQIEAFIGDRFERLLVHLGPDVTCVLSPRDLKWARLFYNQGFLEGTRQELESHLSTINRVKEHINAPTLQAG